MPLPVVTERLRLRPPTLDDLDVWLPLSRDAEEFWFGEPRSDLEQARSKLEWHIAQHEQHGFGSCAVELLATGRVIGAAGLGHLAETDEIEVGYRFLKEHWGRAMRRRRRVRPSPSAFRSSASTGSSRSPSPRIGHLAESWRNAG